MSRRIRRFPPRLLAAHRHYSPQVDAFRPLVLKSHEKSQHRIHRAAGAAPVIAADPIPAKRDRAMALGADFAFDPSAPDFAEKVKTATCGGARVVIEVTGVDRALDTALDAVARFGRVALLGCTRRSEFAIDYYRKVHGRGVTLVGAHNKARPEHDSSPAGGRVATTPSPTC